jgi:hypothetical protein
MTSAVSQLSTASRHVHKMAGVRAGSLAPIEETGAYSRRAAASAGQGSPDPAASAARWRLIEPIQARNAFQAEESRSPTGQFRDEPDYGRNRYGSLTPGGGAPVKENVGGRDQSTAPRKSTWLLENRAWPKLTWAPEKLGVAEMFLEYYTYRARGEPKFVLAPADGRWFENLYQEAEVLWLSASEYNLVS